ARIAFLALGVALSPLPWFAGIGYRAGNDDARDVALEQARVATLDAALAEENGLKEEPRPGSTIRIVAANDADACVTMAHAHALAREAAFVDGPREQASACRELRDGR